MRTISLCYRIAVFTEYQKLASLSRTLVECAFRVWKACFRCLETSAGSILYTSGRECRITVATAMLHNTARKHNIPLPGDADIEMIMQDDDVDYDEILQQNNEGQQLREQLVQRRFLYEFQNEKSLR